MHRAGESGACRGYGVIPLADTGWEYLGNRTISGSLGKPGSI